MSVDLVDQNSPLDGAIERTLEVCGSAACISGTRIPVWLLVEARGLGVSEAQLLIDYPTLRASNLADAWNYTERHEVEIVAEILRHQLA